MSGRRSVAFSWPLGAALVVAFAFALGAGYMVRAKVTRDFGFVFAGSDSYGYNKLAEELIRHHRYALEPAPAPLHWARPPGYPLYVALVKGLAPAAMSGGDGWAKIVRANVWLEIVGTGCALAFLVWRMSGPLPSLLALLLLMIAPFNALATPAALTETLATFLLTATIALLVPVAMGSRRWGWMIAAGVAFACGVLTRPDTLLIAPAFVAAAYGAARATSGNRWRVSLSSLVPSVLAFALTMTPWIARNLVAFHDPHPLGGRIDRYSRPVVHYQGSWAFLRAISHDWQPMTQLTTCYYDLSCSPRPFQFLHAEPTLDEHEMAELDRLLALRTKLGDAQEVSDGFQALADRRRRMHPFRVELQLPAQRLFAMWIAQHDELVPRHAPSFGWVRLNLPLSIVLVIASLLGAISMLRDPRLRPAALVLLAATWGRTILMAYTFYSMPRYLLESVPCAYALIAGGVGVLVAWLSALRRARSST